jgi:hypothetical protein
MKLVVVNVGAAIDEHTKKADTGTAKQTAAR